MLGARGARRSLRLATGARPPRFGIDPAFLDAAGQPVAVRRLEAEWIGRARPTPTDRCCCVAGRGWALTDRVAPDAVRTLQAARFGRRHPQEGPPNLDRGAALFPAVPSWLRALPAHEFS